MYNYSCAAQYKQTGKIITLPSNSIWVNKLNLAYVFASQDIYIFIISLIIFKLGNNKTKLPENVNLHVSATFLKMTLETFFGSVLPASTNANPNLRPVQSG
jgi:hypothetical protein